MYSIRRATNADVAKLAPVFDEYRQFYQQASDVNAAAEYLTQRLQNKESVIWLCEGAQQLVGFTQLYPTFCSVAAARIYVLYDLFVRDNYRQQGIARLLLAAAKEFGLAEGVDRLELATAIDNVGAQALYQKLGWRRDTEFYHYQLELDS